MTDKSSELIKMIEDYSRQNESKSKEIEFLTHRLDKKTTKVEDLKKCNTQYETKIANLKGSLDEVKKFMTFFLNKSFIKSMKG